MIDVTSPASPGIVGSVDTPGYSEYSGSASGVAVAGSYAYVAELVPEAIPALDDDHFGFQIVPRQCRSRHGNPNPDLVWSRPGAPAASFAILPNPVRGTARIEFDLLQACEVELAVYDVAGRRVRQLAHGPQGAGPHAFAWDGTNDNNQAVPAGVYFIRLASEGAAAAERLVLLR